MLCAFPIDSLFVGLSNSTDVFFDCKARELEEIIGKLTLFIQDDTVNVKSKTNKPT